MARESAPQPVIKPGCGVVVIAGLEGLGTRDLGVGGGRTRPTQTRHRTWGPFAEDPRLERRLGEKRSPDAKALSGLP